MTPLYACQAVMISDARMFVQSSARFPGAPAVAIGPNGRYDTCRLSPACGWSLAFVAADRCAVPLSPAGRPRRSWPAQSARRALCPTPGLFLLTRLGRRRGPRAALSRPAPWSAPDPPLTRAVLPCVRQCAVRWENFESLSLPLPAAPRPQALSLPALLSQFSARETVHDVKCDACQRRGRFSKRSLVAKVTPPPHIGITRGHEWPQY